MKRICLLVPLLIILTSFVPVHRTWTAIGDSITYMNEHPEETGNRITKGYMTMVVQKLTDVSYINQGHNGWTAGGIAENIEKLGLVSSDIYSVFLGTNDWWSGRPIGTLEDYKENKGNSTLFGSFRIIVNKLRKLNPKARIILITPMQRVDFVYLKDLRNNAWGSYKAKSGQSLEQFAEAVKAIGSYENFKVVDLFHKSSLGLKHLVKYKRLRDNGLSSYRNFKYPAFTDIPFDAVKDEYPYPDGSINMTYDGLHPSDKGYGVIAKMLIRVIGR
ncbi:MAG TPA: SGNH/GDSL hydrolase family protein [Pedobacter sp.]|nr:SGNH/GDSL hydrolase family protein [Pedobacter sp.]